MLSEIPAIMLRWSDEANWRPVEPYDPLNGPAEEQIERCQRLDMLDRYQYGHKFHAEFRIGTALWDGAKGAFVKADATGET